MTVKYETYDYEYIFAYRIQHICGIYKGDSKIQNNIRAIMQYDRKYVESLHSVFEEYWLDIGDEMFV